jgi:hypothetical protein
MKKVVLTSLFIALLVLVLRVSTCSSEQSLSCIPSPGRLVDKAPGGLFTVEIVFKNTGGVTAQWSVNVEFEGAQWIWAGKAQSLTLQPSETNTLIWNGIVPSSAPMDSIARLIVYYGSSFKALDWWIHIVPSAQLSIVNSTVQ